MSKLILFPNSKARDYYLYSLHNYYSLDITDYKTLSEFYRMSIDKFFKKYSIQNEVCRLEESTAIINLYEALIKFTNKNKNSIIAKQNKNYELASHIYNFIEETTFAKIIIGENYEDLDFLEDIKKIISIYKLNNKSKKLLDEYDIFELFINAINEKKIIDFKEYEEIEIYNFESLPLRYSIFLDAIKKNYNINIKVFMPYDIDKIFSNYKEFYQGTYDLKNSKIKNFAKTLIDKNDKEKLDKYKEQIKLIAGFGIKQEIDTVIDEVIKLENSGVSLSEIALIFSDTQKYRENIAERLKECNIKFNQRRGNFIWRMPLIPVLTSIFFILSREMEIDTDALIKLLSSPYLTNIEGINPYDIRELLYKEFELFQKMPLSDFLYKIENIKNNNEEYKDFSNSIIELIELLKKLISADTYNKIGSAYIEILKFLKIDLIFEENIEDEKNYNSVYIKKDEIFYRDNNSLSIFIEIVLKLSVSDNSTKISSADFHEALNLLIRDEYLKNEDNKEISLTISNLYDARGLKAKYLFILGANNDFISRKPDTFFISNKVREAVNSKYKKYVLSAQNLLSDISYALFLNILSSCYDNTTVYFSFRLKDKDGNLEIPFFYIEDLFTEITGEDFKFENLKENKFIEFIYRENYIPNGENIHNQKENTMSLFFYKENYKYPNNIAFDKNIKNIVNSVYGKDDIIGYSNPQNFISILKEDLANIISVSKIKEIMECPIKYIYTRLFERDSVDSLIMGIDYMEKGSIYHDIFENFYKKIKEKFNNDCKLKESNFESYKTISKETIEECLNKIKIYDNIDREVMEEEINNVMDSFIKYEINLAKNSDYIPNDFEKKINEMEIYSYNNRNIKISGRIDRIDFSYSSDGKINGIRIVDYKASSYKKEFKKGISIEEITNVYLQPILYLKFAIDEYIIKPYKEKNNNDFNIDELVEKCEVVFAVYKESNIVNKEDYIVFDDKEILLSICGYKDGDFNLTKYFDEVFKNIFEDKLIPISGKEQCENCINSQYCECAYNYNEE